MVRGRACRSPRTETRAAVQNSINRRIRRSRARTFAVRFLEVRLLMTADFVCSRSGSARTRWGIFFLRRGVGILGGLRRCQAECTRSSTLRR
jgi:hypothetical protein